LLAASIFDADRGLLATGVVSSVLTQLTGVGSILILAFVPSIVFYLAFKRMNILRVSEVVEIIGLDYLECDLAS
jgi:ammonia channel protein AmtB